MPGGELPCREARPGDGRSTGTQRAEGAARSFLEHAREVGQLSLRREREDRGEAGPLDREEDDGAAPALDLGDGGGHRRDRRTGDEHRGERERRAPREDPGSEPEPDLPGPARHPLRPPGEENGGEPGDEDDHQPGDETEATAGAEDLAETGEVPGVEAQHPRGGGDEKPDGGLEVEPPDLQRSRREEPDAGERDRKGQDHDRAEPERQDSPRREKIAEARGELRVHAEDDGEEEHGEEKRARGGVGDELSEGQEPAHHGSGTISRSKIDAEPVC